VCSVHHAFVTFQQLSGNVDRLDIDKLAQAFEKSGHSGVSKEQLASEFPGSLSLSFENFFSIYNKVHHEQPVDAFLQEWSKEIQVKKTPVLAPAEEKKAVEKPVLEAKAIETTEKPINAWHDFLAGTVAGVILTLVRFV
jgi:hypothetical protein